MWIFDTSEYYYLKNLASVEKNTLFSLKKGHVVIWACLIFVLFLYIIILSVAEVLKPLYLQWLR